MPKTPDIKGAGPSQSAGQTARESGQLAAGAKQSISGSNDLNPYKSPAMPIHGKKGGMAK